MRKILHLVLFVFILSSFTSMAASVGPEPPASGADCSTAMEYGAINDPSQFGSIEAYGYEWYKFTADDDYIVTVSLCNSNYDTKLEIWDDCADSDAEHYNDDACGANATRSRISDIPVAFGETKYVKVYGYLGSYGDYELEITGVLDEPEPVPVSIYSVFALFVLIGGVTVFKLRNRIFNAA